MPTTDDEKILQTICAALWPNSRVQDDELWDADTCAFIADALAEGGYGRTLDPNECEQCDGIGLSSNGRLMLSTGKYRLPYLLKKQGCLRCQGTGMFFVAKGKEDSSSSDARPISDTDRPA